MNDSKLYRKVGKHYKVVGEEFTEFPMPGIWLVQESPNCKSSSVIMKVGDLVDPAPLAALARHRDSVTSALMKFCDDYQKERPGMGPSFSDMVQEVYRLTCKAEEERSHLASIAAHFAPGSPHSRGHCGPVCTFGDW